MYSFSEIFKPLRKSINLIPSAFIRGALTCPDCTAFWVGILVSFLYNPIKVDYNLFFIPSILFCGLISYFFASILYRILFRP